MSTKLGSTTVSRIYKNFKGLNVPSDILIVRGKTAILLRYKTVYNGKSYSAVLLGTEVFSRLPPEVHPVVKQRVIPKPKAKRFSNLPAFIPVSGK